MKRKITIFFLAIALLIFGAHVFGVDVAFAQQDALEEVAGTAGIQGEEDIRLVIARIINIALSFLGIIALIVVLYGGFTWMTAGGNPDKVDRAKKILINGAIGLTIIFLSWAITSFVISALGQATGVGSGDGSGGGSTGGGSLGGSSSSSFVISNVVPQGDIEIRNVVSVATFSRNLEADTVDADSFQIIRVSDGEVVGGETGVSGNKITFTPDAACPEPNEDRNCFDEFTEYQVRITSNIQSTTGANLLECLTTCTFNFTTGNVVDVDDPSVSFTIPDFGQDFAVGGLVDVQVSATDDFAVSVADFNVEDTAFDSVSPAGGDLSDVTIDTVWDSVDPIVAEEDVRYTLEVVVYDLAGNTDSDTVVVDAKPAHCFNGVTDGDEENIDCGGSCGACDGSACTDDSDCAGGSCSAGQCVSLPEITDVSPTSGAPGTYVTISGQNFRGIEGNVYFEDPAGGLIEAFSPSCADGWSDTEIVVEVPIGAGDGPITIVTSDNQTETTNDDNGALIEDFVVNDVERPNLCRISPNSGGVGAFVDVIGNNFGADFDEDIDVVQFISNGGTVEDVRTYNSWDNDRIEVTVPALAAEVYDVQVVVDGVSSNAVAFGVIEELSTGPAISSIDPETGGAGQYITIFGNDFGSTIGLVWFENLTDGTRTIADTSFPDACSTDFWDDDRVTVKVPDVDPEQYNIFIERASDAAESNRVDFSVSSAPPGPGICALTPGTGVTGEVVTAVGENFGASQGTLEFYNAVSATITSWTDEEITATVPGAATTGPVAVVNDGGDRSNNVNFEVSGEGMVAAAAFDAAYVWNFSTGQIPVTPRLVQACNDSDVSAVPSQAYNADVCVNAIVYAHFNTLMDQGTINESTVTLSSCADQTCSAAGLTPVTSTVLTSSSSQYTTFTLIPDTPSQRLSTATRYQVTVTAGVESEDGTPMDQPVSWQFVTSDSAAECDVEEIRVSPPNETLTAQGETTEFTGLPISDQCLVLNAEDFTWQWSVDASIASYEEGCTDQTADSCITVEALAEGEGLVEASSSDSNATGEADLVVNFTDPYVDNQWPACSSACINADVKASFNIGMDPISIESPEAVFLYECDNEFCTNTDREISNRADCIFDGDGECTELSVRLPGNLKPLTYYRVVISGKTQSASGVPLTRLNYGDDFSWTFLTRDDPTECAIDHIEISPDDATLHAIGETQQFTATAFGEPDSCSVAGQPLNGFEYAWNWTDPIDDTTDTDANIASWVKINASLFDVNESGIPEGCTNSCLPLGSESVSAVCGNGIVEVGEDCDDGNTLFGDGCSSQCLNEGSEACEQQCSVSGIACTRANDCDPTIGETCDIIGFGCCGDGTVDVGEECDDGNLIDGDGCSTMCLNEGSRAAGITCGDGVVTQTAGLGGEDCDDGNRSSGDGCSALCLNEGSESFTNLAAICGNGVIESPYETCDDANGVNGDGCSSSCLREGIAAQTVTGFSCGNGVTEQVGGTSAGEDCDGEDGCSEECTWLGSSVNHASPSVCGDGTPGAGEYPLCEVGLAGDGDIDPIQLAVIDDDAAIEVDESGEATQVVEVSFEDATALADLTLTCSAISDSDCPAGFGVDQNGCCSEYPDISLYPSGPDACLNAAIYAIADKQLDLETVENNAFVRYDGAGACPAGHEIYTGLAYNGNNWLARVWYGIKSFFIRTVNAQSAGDCLMPVTGFTQTDLGNGTYKVSIRTAALLAPSSEYALVLLGGEDGVRTATGVKMPDLVKSFFTTGTEICSLDVVEITDETGESPGLFTRFDDDHAMHATPYTQTGTTQQEIQPLAGVYDWDWLDWQEDSSGALFDVSVPNPSSPDQAVVAPTGVNGEATLVAQAEIIENGTSTGQVVAGQMSLFALLCENPWPAQNLFPFEDSSKGFNRGLPVTQSPEWMHFGTYYCRDQQEGLLPEVSIVASADPGADDVVKEYFFAVGDSSDVIGIRIATNPGYLSPLAWYERQGFNGSPSEITVDGFEAVEDGRTVYVFAPNDVTNQKSIYPNIYVISYNEGASADTINIYNQVLENWNFTTNVPDINLCVNNGQYTAELCSTDLDCSGTGAFCLSGKDKLRRDTKRLSDLKTINSALITYGAQNKLCSSTTSQSCTLNADCPTGETCVASYPTIPSGSFVQSMTSSVWSSWDDELGALIGSVPVDPVNTYTNCGEGTSNPDYDADTCVNQEAGVYLCPESSLAYHYRSHGPFSYRITAELEYLAIGKSGWVDDLDDDPTDELEIRAGFAFGGSEGFVLSPAFCDASTFGNSAICGDGTVGPGEACEVGQAGPGIACTTGTGVDGYQAQICANDCSGFIPNPNAACVAFACGNGVIESGESCDDGSLNGSYGFCNSDCSGYDFFCGDGTIAGGEACDCSVGVPAGLPSGGTTCAVPNGVYFANPNKTCSWDCSGPSSYCGDGIIDSGEQCDGDIDTWEGQLCRTGTDKGLPCTTSNDCGGGGVCGGNAWSNACANTNVCLAGTNEGLACTSDANCPGSTCSLFTVQTTRTRTCEDNGAAGDLCTWSDGTFQNVECKAPGTCGDGILDAGEQCDDGNDDDSDGCTSLCTNNVCGDGFIYAGVEQCDEGDDNGLQCSASYGSTCTYCSTSCTLLSSSGAFCGDGVQNGNEFCDAGDLQYVYYAQYEQGKAGGVIGGACDSSDEGEYTSEGICSRTGVCNGGQLIVQGQFGNPDYYVSANGQTCLNSDECGGGSCVFPSCANDCRSACPFTYTNQDISFLDNQIGATRSGAISLLSTIEAEDAEVLGAPTAATLFIPACTTADSLTVDVDSSDRDLPDVDIMFVLDISQSMDDVGVLPGTLPITELQDAMIDTIDGLYDAFAGSGATLRTGWSYIGDNHTIPDFLVQELTSSESQMTTSIINNTGSVAGLIGTPIYPSIEDAWEELQSGTGKVKYMVIFTDGNIWNGDYGTLNAADILGASGTVDEAEYMRGISNLIDEIKADDIKVYSAVLTQNSCDIAQMARWSSMSCSPDGGVCSGRRIEGNYDCSVPDDGITYAYSAQDANGFATMYSDIVSSIVDINVNLTFGNETISVRVEDGTTREIPLPISFSCNEFAEQDILLNMSFIDETGEGTVELSNPRFNYCAP